MIDWRIQSVTCSCDHLTDFAVLQVPVDAPAFAAYAEGERVRLYDIVLIETCLVPGFDSFGWPAAGILFLCWLVLMPLALRIRRDRLHR